MKFSTTLDGGNLELCQTVLTHRNRHRENAADRTAVSIERKFHREKRSLYRHLRNHTVRCKERNRNRQIKLRTALSHIGGRKILPLLPQLDAGVKGISLV